MAKTIIDFQKLENAAKKLSSLTHPARIEIITLLDKNVEMNVTDIQTKLQINQPAASHHLNVLKSNGILLSKRDGQNILYSLNKEFLDVIIDFVNKCG
jgi:ArsR family transcriptional regulator